MFGDVKLKTLLTEDRAEYIWVKLSRSNVSIEAFCDGLLDALHGPISDKSPSEFREHLALIAKKAHELAILIDEVGSLNTVFQRQYDEKWCNAHQDQHVISWNSEFWIYRPDDFCSQLMFIGNKAEEHTETLFERPNAENAFVIFFIKSMDDFFRQTTGKPHTHITLLCVELLFPGYPVSKKSIEKATTKKNTPIKTPKNPK